MPPAPFEYEVPHTDFLIIFTDYGDSMVRDDVTQCITDAMAEIMHEIDTHFTVQDVPIANMVLTSGSAQLKLNTARFMWRTYCLQLMLGVLTSGQRYGFVEVEMEFMQQRGRARRTLGTGSLRLSDAAS